MTEWEKAEQVIQEYLQEIIDFTDETEKRYQQAGKQGRIEEQTRQAVILAEANKHFFAVKQVYDKILKRLQED